MRVVQHRSSHSPADKLPRVSSSFPRPASPQFFTSSAAALPCEIGSDGKPLLQKQQKQQAWSSFMQPSKTEQNWARRMHAQKAQSGSDRTA